jgi:dephospho-CoA kinase
MRRNRLRETRGYSDEKITSIMKNQLSEEEFRKKSDVVIDNNGTKMQGITQVDHAMERLEHGI